MSHPSQGLTKSLGHILLVDDESEFLNITRKLLERIGYRVTAFLNSEKALSHFQENAAAYDIVITDQNMPRIDGIDLFVRIRNFNNTIPVVICSGNCGAIPLSVVCNLGLDACLQKPVDINTLNQTLQQLISARSG